VLYYRFLASALTAPLGIYSAYVSYTAAMGAVNAHRVHINSVVNNQQRLAVVAHFASRRVFWNSNFTSWVNETGRAKAITFQGSSCLSISCKVRSLYEVGWPTFSHTVN
jgi:hypothetical protein